MTGVASGTVSVRPTQLIGSTGPVTGARGLRRTRKGLRTIVTFFVLILLLIPFIWMISSSLKPSGRVLELPPRWIPSTVTTSSYTTVLSDGRFIRYAANSIIVTSATVLLTLVVAAPAAYAVARIDFRGRRIALAAALFTQFIPPALLLVPLFILWSSAGLFNSYISLVLTYTAFVTAPAVFILASFFKSIPKAIEDAAAIDGCSRWRSFIVIILPLARPGLLSAGVWVGVTAWQEFVIALTLTNRDDMRTLPVGLFTFIGQFVAQWHLLLAGAVIATLPIALVVVVLQRYLVEGITAGATK